MAAAVSTLELIQGSMSSSVFISCLSHKEVALGQAPPRLRPDRKRRRRSDYPEGDGGGDDEDLEDVDMDDMDDDLYDDIEPETEPEPDDEEDEDDLDAAEDAPAPMSRASGKGAGAAGEQGRAGRASAAAASTRDPAAPKAAGSGRGRGGGSGGKGGGATSIKDMIEAGLLKPNLKNVTVTYKGTIYRASLTKEGNIMYENQKFEAPSAFSVFVKRLQTPNKQGDDGWRSVHVEGVSLEEWRQKLMGPNAPPTGRGGGRRGSKAAALAAAAEAKAEQVEAPGPPSTAEKAAAPVAEAAAVGTNNWVQCASCSQWRLVPDSFWPSIEASGDQDWFCREATWDVSKYDPYTPVCGRR